MPWNTIYLIPSLVNPLDSRHPPHHLLAFHRSHLKNVFQGGIAEEVLEFPQNLFKILAVTGCMRKHCWDNFFPEDNCESFRQDSCVHLPQRWLAFEITFAVSPQSHSQLSKKSLYQLSSQTPIPFPSHSQNVQLTPAVSTSNINWSKWIPCTLTCN